MAKTKSTAPSSTISTLNDIEGRLYEIGNLIEILGAAQDSTVQLSDGALRGAASIAELEIQRVAEEVAAVRRTLDLQAVRS